MSLYQDVYYMDWQQGLNAKQKPKNPSEISEIVTPSVKVKPNIHSMCVQEQFFIHTVQKMVIE
jgi:hypothetical protein